MVLGIKKRKSKDYLKNSQIIAKMINESPKQVMAYWFFTPYTIPDKRLLDLLNPDKHEVALHVANDPESEWKILEDETNRTVKYYTIHGTDRFITQLLWRRKIGQKIVKVPKDFPLENFNDLPTIGLDRVRYSHSLDETKNIAEDAINQNRVLAAHPDWLLRKKDRGKNHRAAFYDVLKIILDVDKDA